MNCKPQCTELIRQANDAETPTFWTTLSNWKGSVGPFMDSKGGCWDGSVSTMPLLRNG